MKNIKENRLSVPIMAAANDTEEKREKTLVQLRRCGAQRVFIAHGSLYSDLSRSQKHFQTTEACVRFFQKAGLEVGVWILSSCFNDQNHLTP